MTRWHRSQHVDKQGKANHAMSIQQVKAIPIADLMQRIGLEPIRIANDAAWYLSPFRKESNPSFKMSTPKNADHGGENLGDGKKLILDRTARELAHS